MLNLPRMSTLSEIEEANRKIRDELFQNKNLLTQKTSSERALEVLGQALHFKLQTLTGM